MFDVNRALSSSRCRVRNSRPLRLLGDGSARRGGCAGHGSAGYAIYTVAVGPAPLALGWRRHGCGCRGEYAVAVGEVDR